MLAVFGRVGAWVGSAGVQALLEQVVVGGGEAGQLEAVGQVVEQGGLLRACQGVRGQAVKSRGEGEGLGIGDQFPAGQGGGCRAWGDVGVGGGEAVKGVSASAGAGVDGGRTSVW